MNGEIDLTWNMRKIISRDYPLLDYVGIPSETNVKSTRHVWHSPECAPEAMAFLSAKRLRGNDWQVKADFEGGSIHPGDTIDLYGTPMVVEIVGEGMLTVESAYDLNQIPEGAALSIVCSASLEGANWLERSCMPEHLNDSMRTNSTQIFTESVKNDGKHVEAKLDALLGILLGRLNFAVIHGRSRPFTANTSLGRRRMSGLLSFAYTRKCSSQDEFRDAVNRRCDWDNRIPIVRYQRPDIKHRQVTGAWLIDDQAIIVNPEGFEIKCLQPFRGCVTDDWISVVGEFTLEVHDTPVFVEVVHPQDIGQ